MFFLDEISRKISITKRFQANFSYLFGVKLKFSLVEILRDAVWHAPSTSRRIIGARTDLHEANYNVNSLSNIINREEISIQDSIVFAFIEERCKIYNNEKNKDYLLHEEFFLLSFLKRNKFLQINRI